MTGSSQRAVSEAAAPQAERHVASAPVGAYSPEQSGSLTSPAQPPMQMPPQAPPAVGRSQLPPHWPLQ